MRLFVVGHINPDTDSIASAIAYAHLLKSLHHESVIPARAGKLNTETLFVLKKFNVKTPRLIKDGTNKDLVLVDHNEFHQAIKDIKEARIREVIDHHRISGDIKTISPIPFESEIRGATSTIIFERYLLYEKPIPKPIAGLLLSGILSDTLILRSPTTTREDRKAVKYLSVMLGIDYKKYGFEMLKAGCDIIKHPAKKIITSDMKIYEGKHKIAISQVPIVDLTDTSALKPKLLEEMQAYAKQHSLEIFCLMLTDILKANTELLFVGNKAMVEKAFRKKSKDNYIYLPRVVSRKKQVQPKLLAVIG